jgi:hypothetical protein
MKVTIIGGWGEGPHQSENKEWDLDDDRKEQIKEACRAIGHRMAEKGHSIVVGSQEEYSADRHVVRGMLEEFERRKPPDPRIEVIEGLDKAGPLYSLERASEKYGGIIRPRVPPAQGPWPREAAKIMSVRASDVILTIGGLNATYIAGVAALAANKPVVPIATFGGASRQLLFLLTTFGVSTSSSDLDQLNDTIWHPTLIETIFRLGGLDRAPVFLGYCSKARATASAIHQFMESTLGLDVKDWEEDFRVGEGILDEIRAAVLSCKYGVFLFTPDDLVADPERHVPRDNVVFEAGLFMSAHGRRRTLIIVQDGTYVLADYSGHIRLPLKDPGDISPIESGLRTFFSEDLAK